MKTFRELVEEVLPRIQEVFPWDAEQMLESDDRPLLLDVREPQEFGAVRIEGSINVPRGILESACEYGYEETVPELVKARDRTVLVICRSGNRSALAALTMQLLGYQDARSLKTGLKGWNDFELPLVDAEGKRVDPDDAEAFFTPQLSPAQLGETPEQSPKPTTDPSG